MKRASKFFTEEERLSISRAVTEAEGTTSGEIVPVIATVSGRYDRAEDLFGLAFSVIALSLCWLYFHTIRPPKGDWSAGLSLGLSLVLIIVVGGFVVGAVLASCFPALRRPFLTKKEMREEVQRAAVEAFHRFGVRKTALGNGVVIYLSIYERMVYVLGDHAVSEKLPQQDWDSIRDKVVEGIRKHQAAEGLRQAVIRCGHALAHHFPIRPDDRNELTNELRVID